MPSDTGVTNQGNPANWWVYKLVRVVLPLMVIGLVSFSVMLMLAMTPAITNDRALDQMVNIPAGTMGYDIAVLLEEEGIIRNSSLFSWLLRITKADQGLQAGYYVLNPNMNSLDVIDQLRQGKSVTERIIIPEGYDLKQIARTLAEKELVNEDRFISLAHNASSVYGDDIPLELPISSLEGYLFPDTYLFAKGQSEEEIIRQMVARFLEVVPSTVATRVEDSPFSLHEVLTLASIVEREIMVDRERRIVAAVYLNRLGINMPLQADPTVRYVMTEERDRVLYRDLEISSPYNTYQHRGLPPGPIASPGVASIEAVLNPADVDYLFFVSRRDGTHQFSRTFNEHVRARRSLGY